MKIFSLQQFGTQSKISYKNKMNTFSASFKGNEADNFCNSTKPEKAEEKKFSFSPVENFRRKKELVAVGTEKVFIPAILNLPISNYKQFIKLIKKGITDENALSLSKLSKKEFEEAEELLNEGLSASCITEYKNLSPAQKQQFYDYINKGIAPKVAAFAASLDENEVNFYFKLIERETEPEDAVNVAALYKEDGDRALKILDEGFDPTYINERMSLEEKEEKRIPELMDIGVDTINLCDLATLPDKEYERVADLLHQDILPDCIPFIIKLESGEKKDKKFEKFKNKGFAVNSAYSLSLLLPKEEKMVKKFAKKFPVVNELFRQGYDVQCLERQDSRPDELIFSKETYKNNKRITITQILNKDGKLTQSRTEEDRNESNSFQRNGKHSFHTQYNKEGKIEKIWDYVKTPAGNVIGVYYSEASKLLKGVFETTYYNIDDFKTGTGDLVDLPIEQATKTSGKPISTVTQNSDGTIVYKEEHSRNGLHTQRKYSEKKDENGNIKKKSYTYKITDSHDITLLDAENFWEKNADGTVTNIINSVPYTITYDDEKMQATIKHKDREKTIDFASKISKFSTKPLWDTVKTLDVDSLLEIDKGVDLWGFCQDQDSYVLSFHKKLYTGENSSIIFHELGHIKDYNIDSSPEYNTLEDVYEREMKKFEKEIPYNEQEYINYFSPRANLSDSDGISELVAETNMLTRTFGAENARLFVRSQILTRYFPETIALAANLTGANSKEPLI